MASLRTSRKGTFQINFRYGGQQFTRSLETKDETEARELKVVVERTIRHVKEGTLQLPPNPTADQVWAFFRSGGRVTDLPDLAPRITLQDAVSRYLAAEESGPKEPDSLKTELRHTNNFQRILSGSSWLDTISPDDLREYVSRRSKEAGIRGRTIQSDTIRKELMTFQQVWKLALTDGFVTCKSPVSSIKLPKKKQREKFRTWEEIERKISRGGLDEGQIAELWDCLFLREYEITDFLNHVKEAAKGRRFPFIYPALIFCAYTGARRSEMFRAEIDDIGDSYVQLREKKRDKDTLISFREVPLHSKLKAVIEEHLGSHPGGQQLFVKANGETLEDRTSRDAFEAVTKKTKWSNLRGYHVLRHSFASNLARRGVPQHRIEDYMGHGTEEMSRRYRHLFPEDKRADIELLQF